jgi:hypothetical protein
MLLGHRPRSITQRWPLPGRLGPPGRTIHSTNAVITCTARTNGAVLVTDNFEDFPMRDIRVEPLQSVSAG